MKCILFLFFTLSLFFLHSCSVTGQVTQKNINTFLNDSAVRTGHAGICIYEPATGEYLYNNNADKNFIPSSNVKLFTLYAGMKYLGDSLLAAKVLERKDTIFFQPSGDPTFLHKDFRDQSFYNFLTTTSKKIIIAQPITDHFEKYGSGWAWDDRNEDFMPERNRFPIYGNVFTFYKKGKEILSVPPGSTISKYMEERNNKYNDPDWNMYFVRDNKPFNNQQIPFPTDSTYHDQILLLSDTLKINLKTTENISAENNAWKKFYSRPVDSLFRPMMFNSDNFFAEQTLLMVSNERLGFMSDEQMIDTLLKNDLKDIPTKPRWVDGSGLSRYNLFSPKDFVYILDKLQKEFGMDRMKRILPTGGEGTLTNYYEKDAGAIYAKTGSMSNNVSLSGYLITRKNKMLLFSVLINNYTGTGKEGRRAMEKFLQEIKDTN